MYGSEPTPSQKRLNELLESVDRPGDYCVGGSLFTPMPCVTVKGAGELSFPVPATQIEALIAAATRSPYGKGAETVLDTTVRDSWQIDAEHVRLTGRAWPDSLAKIKGLVADGLGLPVERLKVELYKLLVYGPGGFFAEHRDTEKVPGMVATLSLSLPTPGAGGELVVRHSGRSATFDLTALEPSELSFAAFYADCPHEVLPVTDGHRVSLLFNLSVGSPAELLPPPEYREVTRRVADCLARWREEGGADKLAWVLDHEYSEDGLSFDTLKNRDAAVAQVLAKAADGADCELHAAVLRIEERGYPSENPPDDWEGDDIQEAPQAVIGELHRRARMADGWAALDGGRPSFGTIELEAQELMSRHALTDGEPAERSVHPTGNEGVTMGLVYRHGALVVWPPNKTLDIVAGNSIAHAVSWVAAHFSDSPGRDSEHVRQLVARLTLIWRRGLSLARSRDRCEMLRLLQALGQADLAADFLHHVALIDYDGGENESLAAVLDLIGAADAGVFMSKLVEKHLGRCPNAVVALLTLAGRRSDTPADAARRDAIRGAVGSALSGLEAGLRAESEARARSERERSRQGGFHSRKDNDSGDRWIDAQAICDLFVLAHRLGIADEAVAAARAVAGHSEVVTPDRSLVTALMKMHERGGIEDAEAYRVLWRRCVDYLLARSATGPVEPADWTVEVRTTCDCRICAKLREFCRDPVAQAREFEPGDDGVWHLIDKIRRHHPDLKCQPSWRTGTEVLVCTKTRVGHLRRMEEYTEDVRRIESLLTSTPVAERLDEESDRVVRLERALARA